MTEDDFNGQEKGNVVVSSEARSRERGARIEEPPERQLTEYEAAFFDWRTKINEIKLTLPKITREFDALKNLGIVLEAYPSDPEPPTDLPNTIADIEKDLEKTGKSFLTSCSLLDTAWGKLEAAKDAVEKNTSGITMSALKREFDIAKETAEYVQNLRKTIRELRVREHALREKRKAKALESVGQPTTGALQDVISKKAVEIRELKKSFLSAPRQWFKNRKQHPQGTDARIKVLEQEKQELEEAEKIANKEDFYNPPHEKHAEISVSYAFDGLRKTLEASLKENIIRACKNRPNAQEVVGDIATPEIMKSLADDIAEQIILPTLEQMKKEGAIEEIPEGAPAIIRTIIIKHCFEDDFNAAKELRDALPNRIAGAVENTIYQLKVSLPDIRKLLAESNDLKATAVGSVFAQELEQAGRKYGAEDVRRATSFSPENASKTLEQLTPLQWQIIRNNPLIKEKVREEVLLVVDELGIKRWIKEPSALAGFPNDETIPIALLRLQNHPNGSPQRTMFVRYAQALAARGELDGMRLDLPSVSRLLTLVAENPDTLNEQEIANPELATFDNQLLHDPEVRALILEKHALNTAPAILLTDDTDIRWRDNKLCLPLSEARELLGKNTELSLDQDIERANPLFKKLEDLLNEKYIFSKIVGFKGDVPEDSDRATWFEGVGSYGSRQSLFHIRQDVYQRMLSKYGLSATPPEKIDNPAYWQFEEGCADLALELFAQAKTDEEKEFAFSAIPYGADREKFAAVAKEELSKTQNMALADEIIQTLTSGAGRDENFETVRLMAEIMRAPHAWQLEAIVRKRLSDVFYTYRQYKTVMDQLPETDLATIFSIPPEESQRLKEIAVLNLTGIQDSTLPRILELIQDVPTFEFLKALSISNGGRIDDVSFLTAADLAYLKMLAGHREAVLEGVAASDVAATQEKIKLLFSLNYFIRENPGRIPEVGQFLRTLPPNLPRNFIVHHIETLLPLSPEEREVYFSIFQKIELSPSQEIQKLKDSILAQIFNARSPQEALKAFQIIEGVFVKNNLPTIGKIFKVFTELYPTRVLNGKITDKSSPVLQEAGPRRRIAVMYRDLLRAHLESGNRSLRDYLGTLQEGEALFDVADEKGVEALTGDQEKRIGRFLRHVNQLFLTSELGESGESITGKAQLSVVEQYAQLRQSLGVKDGEKTSDRLAEMFLRPMGFATIQETLTYMQNAKSIADSRGRSLEQLSNGTLALRANDLLKGIDTQYTEQILQNGSVAREFLGAEAGSDNTPLDTDVAQVTDEAAKLNFSEAIAKSPAYGYGELLFGVRPDDRFIRTTAESGSEAIKSPKLELFKTGVVGEDHYGIRTGFGTTQIDFMIAKKALANNPGKLEKLFYEVAKNGFYVPIADESGKIIFTSQMYDEYRKTFAGIQHFEGPRFEYQAVSEGDSTYSEIKTLKDQLTSDQERAEEFHTQISDTIKTVLTQNKVTVKDALDNGLLGADLYDTGSTSRHTNLPGGYDFDFALRLDPADFARASSLAAEIKKRFTFTSENDHIEEGGYYQLRVAGVSAIDGVALPAPIDIDIGFARKSDLGTFASHDSLREKYAWVKDNIGTEAYENVLANILFAKKILKEAKAYKKQEDGGFGGIGTENWVMAHGGNAKEAFRAFKAAAYDGDKRVSLETFKQRYKILDAGYNIKFDRYDNYTLRLREEAYNNLLDAIEKYL